MVDMVKKIHKKSSELLHPGEEILGACVVSPVGQFKKSVAFGAVGGLVGAAVGAAIKGGSDVPEPNSQADSFPLTKQSILAVSEQRWILFEQSAMSGAPKGVLGEWSRSEIQSLDQERGKLTSRLKLRFADGSTAEMEAVKAAKPDSLVAAAAQRR
jgi:hypothetical protein